MSRVGKIPVKLQKGVKVDYKDRLLRIEGPKGKLSNQIPLGVDLKIENEEIHVVRTKGETTDRESASLHGTTRTSVHNMIQGCHTGFSKTLNIIGVGYRAAVKGNQLALNLGYSHPIEYDLPEGISAKVNKNTEVTVSGADKVLVGRVAAKIRSFRAPEPYQGKGVKYADERIIRKQGKAAGAK